jgi:hypothetical protein
VTVRCALTSHPEASLSGPHPTPHPNSPPPPADIYKAGGNTFSRLSFILKENAALVAATRAAVAGAGGLNLTDEARPRVAKLQQVAQKLTAAMLRLDGQAALFSDFSAPS